MFGRATITLGIGPHSSFVIVIIVVIIRSHCGTAYVGLHVAHLLQRGCLLVCLSQL